MRGSAARVREQAKAGACVEGKGAQNACEPACRASTPASHDSPTLHGSGMLAPNHSLRHGFAHGLLLPLMQNGRLLPQPHHPNPMPFLVPHDAALTEPKGRSPELSRCRWQCQGKRCRQVSNRSNRRCKGV